MLSSFILHDDFFALSNRRTLSHERRGGLFDDDDHKAEVGHAPHFSTVSYSQVITRGGDGAGTQETKREFSDSLGRFKREHDQSIFQDERRVAGKTRLERNLFDVSKASDQEQAPPEATITFQGVENDEAFHKVWTESRQHLPLDGGERLLEATPKSKMLRREQATTEEARRLRLGPSKAEEEADLAVRDAERALKTAKRHQREVQKKAEKKKKQQRER